jgi:hypothetical protein
MTRLARYVPGSRAAYRSNAVKTVCAQNHSHPSKHEAKKCDELHLLQRAGEISDLKVQPKYPIVIDGEPLKIRSHKINRASAVVYTADFAFIDHRENRKRVLDAKGFDQKRAALLRAIAEHVYRFRVELV